MCLTEELGCLFPYVLSLRIVPDRIQASCNASGYALH